MYPQFLALVPGPVKLLGPSLADIGAVFPVFSGQMAMFSQSEKIQRLYVLLFKDILDFCQMCLEFFSMSGKHGMRTEGDVFTKRENTDFNQVLNFLDNVINQPGRYGVNTSPLPELIDIVEYNGGREKMSYVLIQVKNDDDLDLTGRLKKDATEILKPHSHSTKSDSPASFGVWMSLQVNHQNNYPIAELT